MNREFLKSFVGIDMPLRNNAPDVLDLPEEVFKNGDTIDILRLNGLSPCIAWAMGAATGHTAVALWRADRLYICESTSKSSDWSINGIQCNPYPAWIEMARNAISYHAVFAPLDRTNGEELLDMDKVWQFVDKHVGLDYGFEVVLMGWLDTVRDNLPCPKDRDQDYCLEPEHFEMLFHFVEKVSPEAARVFVPAVQIRAEVPFDTTLLYAYYTAALKGIDPIEIYSIPEQEGWLYQTTRDGNPVIAESMVCNDFVCNVWEEGGLFNGTNVNCAETSVNDNYKLNIYQDPELRHQLCKDQDPENPNCQLLGKYSLRLDSQPGVLPRYNYVPPTDEMFGSCPSMAPDYLAPQDC